MAMARSPVYIPRGSRTTRKDHASSPTSTQNYIERMPHEIIFNILSYLDASALFCLLHTNKHFHTVATDNALWWNVYAAEFKRKGKRKTNAVGQSTPGAGFGVLPNGYWKNKFFRSLSVRDLNCWKSKLRVISQHTGLPSQTERVLGKLNITWELTVSDKCGNKTTYELSWFKFFETCVTLSWDGGSWPDLGEIATLQLHGIRRTSLKSNGLKTPGWKTLLETLDMADLTKKLQFIGQDGLVELKQLKPGFILGVWKGQASVAFVMITLHFHQLTERSMQGSPICSYVQPPTILHFDEMDRFYCGFHDLQLHLALHTNDSELMNKSFKWIWLPKECIYDDYVKLSIIKSANRSEHVCISGDINLHWKSEVLRGVVEGCCIMSLTLLDEAMNNFWCITVPVTVTPMEMPTSFDYSGQGYQIQYEESATEIKMSLASADEPNQLYVTNLDIHLSVGLIFVHFKA